MGHWEDEIWADAEDWTMPMLIPKGAVWIDSHGEVYYSYDMIRSNHLANIVRWLRRKLDVHGPDDLREINPLLTFETLDKMTDAAKRRGLVLALT